MAVYTCVNCKELFVPITNKECYCPACREDGRRKDSEALDRMIEHPERMIDLVSAVLQQAAKDYRADVNKWRKSYTAEDKAIMFETIKGWCHWFKSNNFGVLSMGELDGAKVQKMLNMEIYDKLRRRTNEKLHR